MPKHLKLIARFANVGLTLIMVLGVFGLLGKGNVGGALFFFLIAVLLGFNLYLNEKSAMLLSEEEWLKSEVRKVFLRGNLRAWRGKKQRRPTGADSDLPPFKGQAHRPGSVLR